MESTLQKPALLAAKTTVYWVVTALLCLQMSFTAYAQLRVPQVAEAFTELRFPAYFRVDLAWAKLLGVALLLAPVPARLKEWAFTLASPSSLPRLSSPTSQWATAREMGLGRGYRCAVGALVLLLALPAAPRRALDRASASTLIAAKLRVRVGAIYEKARSGGVCLCINRRKDQGTWGLAREDARESARDHPRGRP
jgi:DoxX-like family